MSWRVKGGLQVETEESTKSISCMCSFSGAIPAGKATAACMVFIEL